MGKFVCVCVCGCVSTRVGVCPWEFVVVCVGVCMGVSGCVWA